MYGIYDTKDNELCVGVFLSRKEVAKYFNTSYESIGSSICRKEKRGHRYLIEKIEEEEDEE